MRGDEKKISGTEMTPGQFHRALFGCAAFLLLAAAAIVFIIDPFYHYHDAWFGRRVQQKNQWEAIGAVRNMDYDALLLGSSTVMNTNLDILKQNYSVTPIKAVANNARTETLVYYLEQAYTGHNLEVVVWSLDPFALAERSEDGEPLETEVRYLADNNPLNDVEYLLNLDVLGEEVPFRLYYGLFAEYDENLSYSFAQHYETGAEAILASYDRPELTPSDKVPKYIKKNVKYNLGLIAAQIEAHPDTDFVFYLPAYSILAWDSYYCKGNMESYLYCWEKAVTSLCTYSNVTIVDVGAADEETVTNLDYYCDHLHASFELSDLFLEEIGFRDEGGVVHCEESRLLTSDSIGGYLDEIRRFTAIFEEQTEPSQVDIQGSF